MLTGLRLAVMAAALIGVAAGLGAFTFGYARGASYLTTNPAACANCHIMTEHYDAWNKSSHRIAATCSDCHMPANFVGKYIAKADNGFWHSVAFTTGRHPDPLRIKPHNRAITERQCRHCHEQITLAIDHGSIAPTEGRARHPEPLACTTCHADVGHWMRN